MEVGNYTQCLLQRIQKIEPQNATKIFGYLLLQYSVEEIVEYVSATEEQIHSLIAEAKTYFTLSPKISFSHNFHPFNNHHIHPSFSPPPTFRALSPRQIALNQHPPFQNSNHFHHNDSWENNCKLFNGHANPDIFNTMLGIGLKELPLEDHMPSPGSLEKIEMEISELLRVRRGMPICLSLLPLLYQEMYGKTLQAEGYLTDSQRHGKVGFSLTKLLARLRSVRLVDRPHGQHCIVLAEDAPKFMKFMNESNDPGNSSSHQIYLTFPAESTFTDADVQNYFNQFGPVHDVRIPHQEKRMFGFVSFYHAETVRQILGIGHPHNICGSRVLVKPYIEKSRLVQRKQAEKLNDEMYFSSLSFDMDSALSPRQISIETSQFHRHSQSLEETRFLDDRFASLSIVPHESTGDDDKAWHPCSNFNDYDSPKIQLPESPFASPRYRSEGLNTAV